MRQGPKDDGSVASAALETAAPANLERVTARANAGAAGSAYPAEPSAARASLARSLPPARSSWRPSAGLTCIERYGRFELLGRIGRGGMAEILLARERSPAGSTRHLVIKRVLPEIADHDEMLHMFLAEARVVMGLAHPNLCQIYEVGEQDGAYFIAMEWVNGATLHQLIRRADAEHDINFAIVARVISQCAEALHHAHTARDAEGRPLHLVHRDVSPHNIMVAFDGRVKLLDFGIAKSTKSTHQTEAGVVKGKVCYMAPEQWLCGPLDARTDVFALGACLYEALTGRVVFKRETQSEVMRAVLREGAPPLAEVAPEVPAALAEITHRALAHDPGDRFQSALELSEALEQYLASRTTRLPTSLVAGYVRRLFRSEVELGPLLERAVRGAHLPSAPVLLPPLPPALLGLPKPAVSLHSAASEPQPGASSRSAHPTAFLSPGHMALHLPPPPPAPSLPVGSAPRAVSWEEPAVASADAQTQSALLRLSVPPSGLSAAPNKLSVSASNPGDSALEPRFSQPALAAHGTQDAEARPAVRTVSMYAPRHLRGALLVALPACALLMGGLWLSTRTSQVADSASLASSAVQATPQASGALAAHQAAPTAVQASAPAASAPAHPLAPASSQTSEPAAQKSGRAESSMGRLSINTRPWSTVYLGARVLGTTPLANVPVPRGALLLKLVDRDGTVHLRKIARSPKRERSVFYDFEAKPARRTAKRAR